MHDVYLVIQQSIFYRRQCEVDCTEIHLNQEYPLLMQFLCSPQGFLLNKKKAWTEIATPIVDGPEKTLSCRYGKAAHA